MLTKDQLIAAKKAKGEYDRAVKRAEDAGKDVQEKLNRLKSAIGSSGNNPANILDDLRVEFAKAYEAMDMD